MTDVWPNAFTRDGELMKIPLENGGMTVFVDDPPETLGVAKKTYAYAGSWGSYHLIRVQHYEAITFRLVHRNTGRITKLHSFPEMSPDGRFLLMSGWLSSRYEIWEQDGDGFTQVFEQTLDPAHTVKYSWVSNTQAVACVTWYGEEQRYSISRHDGQWSHLRLRD
jgi:hypothetical protein